MTGATLQSTVSVIIPTFNRAHTLGRALDSVQQQTVTPAEIIVVDDGSSDETATLLREQYPAVTCLQQPNQGVSHARNRGIEHANGDWIALLDSDDEWLPDKLQRQLTLLGTSAGVKLCHGEEIWIRNGKRVNARQKHRKYGGEIFHHCLPLCVISPSAALIHKSVFDDIGLFDESLPVCEDYDFWLRFCARSPVAFVEQPVVIKHGGHADQLSRKLWGMDRYRVRALTKLLRDSKLSAPQSEQVLQEIQAKCDILLTGARKHGNIEVERECFRILENLHLEHPATNR